MFVWVCWFLCCVTVMELCVSAVVCGKCMTLWQQGTTSEQLLSPSGTAGSTLQSVPLTPLEATNSTTVREKSVLSLCVDMVA